MYEFYFLGFCSFFLTRYSLGGIFCEGFGDERVFFFHFIYNGVG